MWKSLAKSEEKSCTPFCRIFRCAQKALDTRSRKYICKWANDICIGGKCKYAVCLQRKLLPNGICALKIKRRTIEEVSPEKVSLMKAEAIAKAKKKLEKLGI